MIKIVCVCVCMCVLVHSLSSWIENETPQSLLCKCMVFFVFFFSCLNLCVAVCRQTSFPAFFWRCFVKKSVCLFWPPNHDPVFSSTLDIPSLQKIIASNYFFFEGKVVSSQFLPSVVFLDKTMAICFFQQLKCCDSLTANVWSSALHLVTPCFI